MATAAAASSPPGAAAATESAPTGAGELEGLIHGTVSFLGGLWSSRGRKAHDGDETGEPQGQAAFEDFDMLVRGDVCVKDVWVGVGCVQPRLTRSRMCTKKS